MSEHSSKGLAEESGAVQTAGRTPFWAVFVWPAVYLVLRIAAPFIPMPFPVAGSILATVLFLLLPLLWLRTLSFQRVKPAVAVLAFLALALLWSEVLLLRPFNWLPFVPHHGPVWHAIVLLVRPLADLALITAAALLGSALAGIISDPKMLLPVAIVGAMVDYWGVYLGTTNALIKAAPKVVTFVSASIPSFGGGVKHGLRPVSFVGFGDWLFLSMFLTVAARYNLRPRRTFWALLALLVPAMLIVLLGDLDYLPAVVPMALAVILVNGRRLKLTRAETFATIYAIILVLLAIGLYMLAARFLGHPTPAPAHK